MFNQLTPFKLFLALLVMNLTTAAQTNIQLIIKSARPIELVDMGDISMTKNNESVFKDTINFDFNNTNPDAYILGWTISGKRYHTGIPVWLNKGKVILNAHTDSNKLVIDTVINSPFYYYERNYFKQLGAIFKARDTATYCAYTLQIIEENLDNPFSLYIASIYLNVIQNDKDKVYQLQQILTRQGEKFSGFRSYPEVTDRLNSILLVEHLNLAEISLIDQQLKLAVPVLKGADFYILDFWFLGCLPCRADHKIIKTKLVALKRHNVAMIGISTDPVEEYYREWKKYISTNQYRWPNYMQPAVNKISDSLGIDVFPNYVVINNKGQIIGRYKNLSEVFTRFNIP